MTINNAAHQILTEAGHPLFSRDIAKKALELGLVTSQAKDPISAHAQTIEKNIRGAIYNKPELIFIQGPHGRMIGLPSMRNKELSVHKNTSDLYPVTIKLPKELIKNIQLATQAEIADTQEETIIHIIKKGLNAISGDIKDGLQHQIKKLNEL